MGILDDIASVMSGGAASVERSMNVSRLKRQLDELAVSRHDLLAQLGEGVLPTVKNDPLLRERFAELLDVIERVDSQRAALQAELANVEARMAQERAAMAVYDCPKCGRRVMGTQAFCTGCGTPTSVIKEAMEEADAAIQGKELPTCYNCGARLVEGDLFCSQCGTRQ